MAHVLTACGVFFGPAYFGAPAPPRITVLEAQELTPTVIYLPRLGGGSEGNGSAGGGPIIKRKGVTTAPAHSSEGISYPGPQAIVSDPPDPTNRFQTLMRPAVKNPTVLKTFVPAPNIIQSAQPLPAFDPAKPARPELPLSMKAPTLPQRPDLSANEHAPSITTETPKLTLPADAQRPAPPSVPQMTPPKAPTQRLEASIVPLVTNDAPKLTLPADAPRPAPPSVPQMTAPKAPTQRGEASAAPQFSPATTSAERLQDIVSLSPTPAPPGPVANLPDGEARGRFAISPEPNPGSPDAEAGSKLQGSGSLSASIGSEPEARSGNAASLGQSGVSNGSAGLAIGGNGGSGSSTGKENGAGNGGKGSGSGGGSANGEGLGAGAGANPGAGSGAGTAEGGGAFRGITIGPGAGEAALGSLDARFSAMVYPVPLAVVSKLRKNPIVVSTGAVGGGGLDVYGALKCGKVYTIFLPMPGANWTMQYCEEAGSVASAPTSTQSTVIHIQPVLVPPDPDLDSRFDFQRLPVPQEKAHKMLLLKGVLQADGTVADLQVFQGIVPQMDEAARIAFSRWKFKPAIREGKPVAVNLLIGIPILSQY